MKQGSSFSLACFSWETQKMQAFLFLFNFFFVCPCQKRIMAPGVPREGQWKLGIRIATCEESLGKIDAKDVEFLRNGSVHEFYRSKALITLEQLNTSVETSMRWGYKLVGFVNFHCMQMSLVKSVRVIFGGDWNDAPCSSRFCLLPLELIFVYYTRSQSSLNTI